MPSPCRILPLPLELGPGHGLELPTGLPPRLGPGVRQASQDQLGLPLESVTGPTAQPVPAHAVPLETAPQRHLGLADAPEASRRCGAMVGGM